MSDKRRTITKKPWAKQADEVDEAYAAFRVYLELGQGKRSLEKAYRIHTGMKGETTGQYKRWFRNHRWYSRALAYDQRIDKAFEERLQEVVAKETPNLAHDIQRIKDRMLSQANILLDHADRMLSFPLSKQEVRRTNDKGDPVDVTVMPMGWKAADIPRYLIAVKNLLEYLTIMDPMANVSEARRSMARSLLTNPKALEAFNHVKELVHEQANEDNEA